MKFLILIFKNLGRSPLRTTLTGLGTMVLVFVVTLIWSVLAFLDRATSDKTSNFKAIVTERWQLPSRMPFAYATDLSQGAARRPEDVRPIDSMTWQFFGGTVDPKSRTRESLVFAFCLEPKKLATMMDDLDSLPDDQAKDLQTNIGKMENNRQAMIIGRERLASIKKKVGERITLHSINFKDIKLEVEIVGLFPPGRYDQSAAINRDYLNESFEQYKREHNNQPHPMADQSLNLVWLKVPDSKSFEQIAAQIESSPSFTTPAVKTETASAGISAFLDAYKDLIWGMRWLLAPAILATLSLVIANAISISVRERWREMAVLKVLGFRPGHLLFMVLGEALLVGVLSGVLAVTLTYYGVNRIYGGVPFPIAFFPKFVIPDAAFYWGPIVGGLTAFAGSIVPALTARGVRVSDVFSKVT